MPKPRPRDVSRVVFHAMNRATVGQVLFASPADYDAFIALCVRAQRRTPLRILAFCLMPNHWHFALWVEDDREMPAFLQSLGSGWPLLIGCAAASSATRISLVAFDTSKARIAVAPIRRGLSPGAQPRAAAG